MRTLGIDLAVKAAHKAVVMEASGKFVSPVLPFHTRWEELEQLVVRAREGVEADHPLQAVMEPTGMAWFPVAVALSRLKVAPIYLVNGQKVAALRRFYKRPSSSDRISCRVLAKMPLIDEESLYALEIATAEQLACQRGCKERDRLQTQITAIKNRLQDTDRFAWPGLTQVIKKPFSPQARFFRETWYDPARVVEAGERQVRHSFLAIVEEEETVAWADQLGPLALGILQIYGRETLDYGLLQQEVRRQQRLLAYLERQAEGVWQKVTRPLYRQLHPSQHLESLYGVGEKSAAVYASYIGRAARFPTNRKFRGWHGLIPDSRQSGEAESKGLHISQAGPDLVKKFGYLGADVARHYDPQIAAVYYDQMVGKGKHHNQAVCASATHLLDRVRVVLLEDRPYELRDVAGTPVTPTQARAIIAEHYTVPKEVRERTNQRARKERAEQRAERQQQKRRRRSRSAR
jgi:transposase